MSAARKNATKAAKTPAKKSASKPTATSSKSPKSKASTAKKSARDALEDAGKARDQMARDQRMQEANGVLVTAERELQFGRFAGALDLAQQAEALAGGGLLPAGDRDCPRYRGAWRFDDKLVVTTFIGENRAAP